MRRRGSHRKQGVTLFEVISAIGISIVLLGSLFGVLLASQTSALEQSAQMEMEFQARRVLRRIAEDFRGGMMSSLSMDAISDSPSISMAQAAGYENNTVLAGATVGYRFEPDLNDPANGADDDGDGYVDEGRVLRSEGGEDVLIAGNVNNLGFTLDNERVLCAISLQKNVRGRRLLAFTNTVEIFPRN